jgi:hypothetical protein
VNNEWTELTEISGEVRVNYVMEMCVSVFTYGFSYKKHIHFSLLQ